MKDFECNSVEDIYWLSRICLNGSHSNQSECVKFYDSNVSIIRKGIGIWFLLVAILGTFGNLMTLIAIPYAARHKRHNFHIHFNATTLFILNLAFVDFCHCLFFTWPQVVFNLFDSSPFGVIGCKIVVVAGFTSISADMLGLAMISLSRCLHMTRKENWSKFCDRKRNIGLLFFIVWMPSFVCPFVLHYIKFSGFEPGWNCEYGGCALIQHCNVEEIPQIRFRTKPGEFVDARSCNFRASNVMHIFTAGFPVLAIMIMVGSYLCIWYKVHGSLRSFSESDHSLVILHQREMKMSMTILIIIVLTFLLWLPFSLMHLFIFDFSISYHAFSGSKYIWFVILFCIFESSFAINFFLYAARCDQYKAAFLDIFKLLHFNSYDSQIGTFHAERPNTNARTIELNQIGLRSPNNRLFRQ